jgi:hypothetical protein
MAKLCAGGVRLRDQIDRRWPKRDRRSDGWIGDKAHQAAGRISDHNPDSEGIVYAIDIDENLGHGQARNGRTAQHLADQLVAYAMSDLPGHARIKYVVYENQIASGTYRNTWWKWRGKGYGHTQHIHISFTKAAKRDNSIYPLPILTTNPVKKLAWSRALKNARK